MQKNSETSVEPALAVGWNLRNFYGGQCSLTSNSNLHRHRTHFKIAQTSFQRFIKTSTKILPKKNWKYVLKTSKRKIIRRINVTFFRINIEIKRRDKKIKLFIVFQWSVWHLKILLPKPNKLSEKRDFLEKCDLKIILNETSEINIYKQCVGKEWITNCERQKYNF